jgi:hypothetical protein
MQNQAADKTMSLPPQITPFIYPTSMNMCDLSVYCPEMSSIDYSMISATHGHPLAGENCLAIEVTNQTQAGHDPRCYPEGYFTLFPDEWQELNMMGSANNEGDRSTAAYVGGAAILGWTIACTTTITHQDSLYPQAWYCPPGEWECAASTAISDEAAPQRLCRSLVTGATWVWMSWDPPLTYLDGVELYTWNVQVTAEEPQYAATVYHKVFPVQMGPAPALDVKVAGRVAPATIGSVSYSTVPGTSFATGTTDGSGRGHSGMHMASGPSTPLSAGAKAGIGIGVSIAFFGLLLGAVILYRRRKMSRKTPVDNIPTGNAEQGTATGAAKADFGQRSQVDGLGA